MYHLDNLRRNKKIKVETFCEGICSDRQYRRLLSGEQHISPQKLVDFCNKLGISLHDFYYSANEKDKYEYSKIVKIYQMLTARNFTDFRIESKKISKDRLVSDQNKRFYTFCILKYQYLTKEIPNQECATELAKLCNYPACLEFKTFDFVDIVSLEIIAAIEVENKKTDALDLLSKILNTSDMIYISSESRHILPNIYGAVAILFSRLQLHDTALRVANSGINYSILQSNSSTLTYLYYVKFYTLLQMGQIRNAQIEAVKALSNAISRGKKTEFDMVVNELSKELKTDPFTLFMFHKDNLF